ncbi:MAG: acetyl-CoA carboxylase biotin carboxyl carrier protein [Lautropia sp.]
MDLRKLKTLVDLVAESGISELEITEAEGTVRIVKSAPPAPMPPYPWPMQQPVMQMPVAHAAPAGGAEAPTPASAPASAPPIAGQVVKSPMVGTFYRSPNPESEPFVKEGSVVAVGDALCIIEAMKLMNEIESEISGTVRQVLVENGQPVEYGQPLFIVD